MAQRGRAADMHDTLRHDQQEAQEKRALVEAMFEQALVRQQQEEANGHVSIVAIGPDARAHLAQPPVSVAARQAVHHTELPWAQPGEPLAEEWNTYCREVGRLLAEGQEGRHVLIKDHEILGIFDSAEAAYAAGSKNHVLFVHVIREEEPYLRIRGINYPWPSSHSPN
jgi:hypothetical protein